MNQRSQFRFDVFQTNPVTIALTLADRPPILGQPSIIHPDGVRACFRTEQGLGLPLGTKLLLTFTSTKWVDAVETVGRLHFRHDDKSLCDLGFSFIKRKEIEEELIPRLNKLFDRRSAARATPDPKEPIEVLLEDATGRGVRGLLVSISSTGLLMRINAEEEAPFASTALCRVAFLLPGSRPISMSFEAMIRERRLSSNEALIAVEFDAARTAAFGSQQDKLLGYVLKRQPLSRLRRRAG